MRGLTFVVCVAGCVLCAPLAGAQPTAPLDASHRENALAHFKAGLDHFDRQEWSAALAEFLRSRELYPTRAATKNAAVCLRKEGRFDEALDLYEALLRDFPDLPQPDRDFATSEIRELQASIGAVGLRGAEPGASVVIDGRDRGATPLAAPLRLSAGSHVVRVFKTGFVPFEARVDVAGQQTAVLEARLVALAQNGRLRVAEQSGRSLDVIVDGIPVGKTPWDGGLAPGDHTVVLRGDGRVGTQPASVPVRVNQVTAVTLIAEDLGATARIEPTPAGAVVSIDGVSVGRGVWEGNLRAGQHVVEVAAEGFLPSRREVTLEEGKRVVLAASLDRDPTSPLWGSAARSHFAFELDGAAALGPTLSGGVASGCTGSCSSALVLGGLGVVHAAYQFPQGAGFGVDGGYLTLTQSLSRRAATLANGRFAQGVTETGTVSDRLELGGLTVGASAYYRLGDPWTITLRLGVGAFLASASDARTGEFETSPMGNPANTSYALAVSQSGSATYVYAAPEVRIGRRLGTRLEISLGVEAHMLLGLSVPSWNAGTLVQTGPSGTQGDGLGAFPSQTLAGSFAIAVMPGVGLRYEL